MFKQILGFATLVVSATAFEQWDSEDALDPAYIAINSVDWVEPTTLTSPMTYEEYLEANKNYKPTSTNKPPPATLPPGFSTTDNGVWAVPPGTDFSKIDPAGVEEFHRNWLIVNGV